MKFFIIRVFHYIHYPAAVIVLSYIFDFITFICPEWRDSKRAVHAITCIDNASLITPTTRLEITTNLYYLRENRGDEPHLSPFYT